MQQALRAGPGDATQGDGGHRAMVLAAGRLAGAGAAGCAASTLASTPGFGEGASAFSRYLVQGNSRTGNRVAMETGGAFQTQGKVNTVWWDLTRTKPGRPRRGPRGPAVTRDVPRPLLRGPSAQGLSGRSSPVRVPGAEAGSHLPPWPPRRPSRLTRTPTVWVCGVPGASPRTADLAARRALRTVRWAGHPVQGVWARRRARPAVGGGTGTGGPAGGGRSGHGCASAEPQSPRRRRSASREGRPRA